MYQTLAPLILPTFVAFVVMRFLVKKVTIK